MKPQEHIPVAFNPAPQTAGGLAVVAKYGAEHMAEIGRKGYEATVQKHFNGDREAANRWLAAKGQFIIDEGYRALGLGKFRDPGPHPAHHQ